MIRSKSAVRAKAVAKRKQQSKAFPELSGRAANGNHLRMVSLIARAGAVAAAATGGWLLSEAAASADTGKPDLPISQSFETIDALPDSGLVETSKTEQPTQETDRPTTESGSDGLRPGAAREASDGGGLTDPLPADPDHGPYEVTNYGPPPKIDFGQQTSPQSVENIDPETGVDEGTPIRDTIDPEKTDEDGFPLGQEELWGQWLDTYRNDLPYPNVHIEWDVPIEMSDGTILKGNLIRPVDANGQVADEKLPTVIQFTPYSKLAAMFAMTGTSIPLLSDWVEDVVGGIDAMPPFSGYTQLAQAFRSGIGELFGGDERLVRAGYNMLVVDHRGTGMSEGKWQFFSNKDREDYAETIDWAAKQDWCNGKVASSGYSYSAINQLAMAEKHPPALRAMFLGGAGDDLVRTVIGDGGGFNILTILVLEIGINVPKWFPDLVASTNNNYDYEMYQDRLDEPWAAGSLIFDTIFDPPASGVSKDLMEFLDDKSAIRKNTFMHPELINVPTVVFDGWHDLYANNVPNLFNKIPLPPTEKKLFESDGFHVTIASGFGRQDQPPRLDVLQRAWFDHWLKDVPNGVETLSPITMKPQGGWWEALDQWPRKGMKHHKLFLSTDKGMGTAFSIYDGSLNSKPQDTEDDLSVTPTPLGAVCSRETVESTFGSQGYWDSCNTDERIHEIFGVTFTSDAVEDETRISGPINVHLNVAQEAPDGYWDVELTDVDPNGQSTMLTHGQLITSLRAIDDSKSQKSPDGAYTAPYHPMTITKYEAVTPDVPVQIDVPLGPTDAVIAPGHKLRVDVYTDNWPHANPLQPMLSNIHFKPGHIVFDPKDPNFLNVPLSRVVPGVDSGSESGDEQ